MTQVLVAAVRRHLTIWAPSFHGGLSFARVSKFLNLDHIVRVRFNKSWNKEGETLVAEIETQLGGEVRPVCRYRGSDAEALQSALLGKSPVVESPVAAGVAVPTAPAAAVGSRDALPTLADL